MTGPGAAETAASFIGSEVSESHERKSTKFLLRHSGVSSAVKELPIRSSPQRVPLYLSPSSSASVVVTLGCRQLQRSCHFARPQSESVSVFVGLRLRPSTSSPVSDFVYLRLRLSPSWYQVVGPESVGCLSTVYIEGLETTVACAF